MFYCECKKIGRSIPFLLYVAVMLLVFFSQAPFPSKVEPPVPGQESYSRYGHVYTDDPDDIVPVALETLYYEFTNNQFTTYPIGFYKSVKLRDEDRKAVAEIFSGLLEGVSAEELLMAAPMEYPPDAMIHQPDGKGGFELIPPPVTVELTPAQLPYDRFQAEMTKIDKVLGGGSDYNEKGLRDMSRRSLSYEEAAEQYRLFQSEDRYSGGYARLFADYLVIFATVMPVFIAVSEGMRDRRARMREIIWSRRASAAAITFSRFFAIAALCMIPILVFAVIDTFYVLTLHPGENVDLLSFFRQSFMWVLPGILISTAVGMLLTELTDTPIAILVMGIWWLLSLNGAATLVGNYVVDLFTLIPRHNSKSATGIYLQGLRNLVLNRCFYAGLAVVLTALAAFILSRKRKGRWPTYDSIKAAIRNRKVRTEV